MHYLDIHASPPVEGAPVARCAAPIISYDLICKSGIGEDHEIRVVILVKSKGTPGGLGSISQRIVGVILVV